ncbi:hypothetical protein GCM10028895_07810 [Pontibacter rugosus]
MIVKYLHFHTKSYVDAAKQKRVAQIMVVMLVIVLLPSIYFLYNVYIGVKTRKQIENLIITDFIERNNEVLKWEVQHTDSLKYIKIYSVGKQVDEQLVQHYNDVLTDNNLEKYKIRLVQLDVSPEEVQQIAYDITHNLTQDMLKTMELQKLQEQRTDSVRRQQVMLTKGSATQDLRMLFPEIQKVQVGEMVTTSSPTKPDTVTLVMIDWVKPAKAETATAKSKAAEQKLRAAQVKEYESRIKGYLRYKLQRDSVQVVSTF